jgi:hypothetical protein
MKISHGRVRRVEKGRAIPCCRCEKRGQRTERNIIPASVTAFGAVADVFLREQKKEVAAAKMKRLIIMFAVVLLTAFLLATPGRMIYCFKLPLAANCRRTPSCPTSI